VRGDRSLRWVARQFRVSLLTVQRWFQRAKHQRLDWVDWSDRPAGPRQPANRILHQAINIVKQKYFATGSPRSAAGGTRTRHPIAGVGHQLIKRAPPLPLPGAAPQLARHQGTEEGVVGSGCTTGWRQRLVNVSSAWRKGTLLPTKRKRRMVMPRLWGDPVGCFGETPGPKRRLTQPPYNSPP
jgi:hypothetical protein